jgi:NTE family protein
VVPFLLVGPRDRGTVGRLAAEVFDRTPDAAGRIRRIASGLDVRVLGRLLQGDGPRRGDLLSYLYFDPEFMEASIDLGRRDAGRLFRGVPAGEVPWRTEP